METKFYTTKNFVHYEGNIIHLYQDRQALAAVSGDPFEEWCTQSKSRTISETMRNVITLPVADKVTYVTERISFVAEVGHVMDIFASFAVVVLTVSAIIHFFG